MSYDTKHATRDFDAVHPVLWGKPGTTDADRHAASDTLARLRDMAGLSAEVVELLGRMGARIEALESALEDVADTASAIADHAGNPGSTIGALYQLANGARAALLPAVPSSSTGAPAELVASLGVEVSPEHGADALQRLEDALYHSDAGPLAAPLDD